MGVFTGKNKMSVEITKYDLYEFFKSHFKLKREDDIELKEWLQTQFNYENGILKTKE